MENFNFEIISGKEYAIRLTNFILKELEIGTEIDKIYEEKIEVYFKGYYFQNCYNVLYPIEGIEQKGNHIYLVNHAHNEWKHFTTDTEIIIFPHNFFTRKNV